MGSNETKFRSKEIVESQSDNKCSRKSKDSGSSLDRARKGMGFASAAKAFGLGVLAFTGGVHGDVPPGSALARVGDDTANASVPGLEMKQLSNHTQYTELASILRNVTPDTIKHLENVGVPKEEMQCIQAENTPKKKGGFARREHIKRLYEANRRLLQSCETNCTAYTPCLPENVSCHEERACADPDGRGYKTWWNFDYCSDLNNGQHCPSYEGSPSDTGTRC